MAHGGGVLRSDQIPSAPGLPVPPALKKDCRAAYLLPLLPTLKAPKSSETKLEDADELYKWD